MGVRGDFRKLDRLTRRVAAMDSPQFKNGLYNACGAAALAQLMDQFRNSEDPYGRPWAPLKRRSGVILVDTARGRNSYRWQLLSNGFAIVSNVGYMRYHQRGAFYRARVRQGHSMAYSKGGRLVRAGTKRHAYTVVPRAHMMSSWTLPRRQMIPEKTTGGLGKWGPVIKTAARRYTLSYLGKRKGAA